MALTSVGYAGPITPASWATLTAGLGASYGVTGEDPTQAAASWRVTTVAGQDRTVSVAAGQGFGHGVLDTTDAAETIQLASVGSGSRWDTIVARRTWSTNTTTLIAVQGTATQAVSASRLVGKGVVDDQPIALVQVTAGQQLPTGIVDLRAWRGNGGVVAASSAALAYLDTPGSSVFVGGVQWVRTVLANGTTAWTQTDHVEVVDNALHGAWSGQQRKTRFRRRVFTTNGDGDVIVMPQPDFTGIFSATLTSASTFPLICSPRILSGNLVFRVWDLSGLRPSTSFLGILTVHYW